MATAITATDLIQRIQRADGGMASTEQIAYSLGIPETQVAPLTAQARSLGLITTERDPRTLSPMHRLTEAGRDRTPHVLDRSPSAAVARAPDPPHRTVRHDRAHPRDRPAPRPVPAQPPQQLAPEPPPASRGPNQDAGGTPPAPAGPEAARPPSPVQAAQRPDRPAPPHQPRQREAPALNGSTRASTRTEGHRQP